VTEVFLVSRQMENSCRQQVSVKFLLNSETHTKKVKNVFLLKTLSLEMQN